MPNDTIQCKASKGGSTAGAPYVPVSYDVFSAPAICIWADKPYSELVRVGRVYGRLRIHRMGETKKNIFFVRQLQFGEMITVISSDTVLFAHPNRSVTAILVDGGVYYAFDSDILHETNASSS